MGLIELSQIKNMDTSVVILQVTLIAGTDTERQLVNQHTLPLSTGQRDELRHGGEDKRACHSL